MANGREAGVVSESFFVGSNGDGKFLKNVFPVHR